MSERVPELMGMDVPESCLLTATTNHLPDAAIGHLALLPQPQPLCARVRVLRPPP